MKHPRSTSNTFCFLCGCSTLLDSKVALKFSNILDIKHHCLGNEVSCPQSQRWNMPMNVTHASVLQIVSNHHTAFEERHVRLSLQTHTPGRPCLWRTSGSNYPLDGMQSIDFCYQWDSENKQDIIYTLKRVLTPTPPQGSLTNIDVREPVGKKTRISSKSKSQSSPDCGPILWQCWNLSEHSNRPRFSCNFQKTRSQPRYITTCI